MYRAGVRCIGHHPSHIQHIDMGTQDGSHYLEAWTSNRGLWMVLRHCLPFKPFAGMARVVGTEIFIEGK